jgi:hypothetical protein
MEEYRQPLADGSSHALLNKTLTAKEILGKSADYLGIYGAGSANAGVTYVHANPKYINVNRWDYKDNKASC